MIARKRDSQARILELMAGLLPDEVAHGYATLLDQRECSAQEAGELVGEECFRELMRRGLAHRVVRANSGQNVIRPTDPTLAFRDVLHELQTGLSEASGRLIDAHQRVTGIQRLFSRQVFEHEPEESVRVVTDPEEIQSLSTSLINLAQHDYLGLHTWQFTVPPRKGEFVPRPARVVDREVRRRSIYSTEYFDSEIGYHNIQTAIRVGDEVRIYRDLPMKMKLIDEEAVLLPLTTSGASAALFVKAPVVVKAFRQYFELLWARATPVASSGAAPAPDRGVGGDTPTDLQLLLLKMMALGLKDESIANRSGMSLRTVRRHIAAIMEMLSAETRFAAGVTAAKRGWIE